MARVKTADGLEWLVTFDAFAIADVKKEVGIDLADGTATGWLAIENDDAAVGRVLAIVCGEEIRQRRMTTRAFARQVRGEVINAAREALLSEGADFFPPKRWSEIRSNLEKRKAEATMSQSARMLTQSPEMVPLMEAFLRLPPETQARLIDLKGDTSSLPLEDNDSVSGPAASQPGAATDWPASVALPLTDTR